MKEIIIELLATVEAIYFLAQALEENRERLTMIREHLDSLMPEEQTRLITELENEIKEVREHYGATGTDSGYRELYDDARSRSGYSYLPKLHTERHWFQKYDRVFPSWSNVPLHGLVIFDGLTGQSMHEIFLLEASIFDDAKFFQAKASETRKGIDEFRKRDRQDQLALLAYSRAAATTTFHFLEAYLNGLAYDCFQEHHDNLEIQDHDLLAEWDSKNNSRKFVSFTKKLFQYPQTVAKIRGRKLDLSDFEPAKLLAEVAKDIRDALTHPSPYINPKKGFQEKIFWVTSTGFDAAEMIFNSAKKYVHAVENGIGNDPNKTLPWLFE